MATGFVSTFDMDKDGTLQVAELSLVFARLDKDQSQSLEWSELGLAVVLPQSGDVAPDFELPYRDRPNEVVKLSSFAGKKPVALIFGSYT